MVISPRWYFKVIQTLSAWGEWRETLTTVSILAKVTVIILIIPMGSTAISFPPTGCAL